MKFTIKGQNNITLFLEEAPEGIELKGKDEEGIKKTILSFSDGIIYPIENAQLKGLKTDKKGRVVIEIDDDL